MDGKLARLISMTPNGTNARGIASSGTTGSKQATKFCKFESGALHVCQYKMHS